MPALRLLAVLLALAGCTAPAAKAPVQAVSATPAAVPRASGGGVIVAVRPASRATPSRRSVLAALGLGHAAAADDTVEFIVRGDDGAPISVMQADAGDLRTGDRVALIPGARTRIAPAPAVRAGP
jgi:outer membrane lipoprotein SlyB